MDLGAYVGKLREHLSLAAEPGGQDVRAAAERLAASLESSVRLTLLDALSAAAEEITRELAPGSVDVRLHRGEPEFVVTPPEPAAEPGGTSAVPFDPADGATARINLRLPEQLKARVEQIAGREGVSVNTWLVRAAAEAVDRAGAGPGHRGGPRSQRFTGWVR
jgi:hypothetical protein